MPVTATKKNKLFNYIKNNFCLAPNYTLKLKTDTTTFKPMTTKELCLVLSIQQCMYSFMYNGKRPVGAELMIKIHELTKLSIAEIKSMVDW
jgi:hypothetical protein